MISVVPSIPRMRPAEAPSAANISWFFELFPTFSSGGSVVPWGVEGREGGRGEGEANNNEDEELVCAVVLMVGCSGASGSCCLATEQGKATSQPLCLLVDGLTQDLDC